MQRLKTDPESVDLKSVNLAEIIVSGGCLQEPPLGIQNAGIAGLVLQLQLLILEMCTTNCVTWKRW